VGSDIQASPRTIFGEERKIGTERITNDRPKLLTEERKGSRAFQDVEKQRIRRSRGTSKSHLFPSKDPCKQNQGIRGSKK